MEEEIISFLKGNDSLIREKIMEKINFHSENLNYESALELKTEFFNEVYAITSYMIV